MKNKCVIGYSLYFVLAIVFKIMNELKFKWSISTIKIFLDNGNPDIDSELMTNKEYLHRLVKKLRAEYIKMFLKDQEETTIGKKYLVAINEIEDWITNCH